MKVYGWQSFRNECKGPHHQTREIVAARSKAEAARLAGYKHPARMFNLCETGNEREIAVAMTRPGVVFWAPISSRAQYVAAEREDKPS
jgi:hypothetical protein